VSICKGCIYEPKSERGRCTVKALYGPDYCYKRDGRAERRVGLQGEDASISHSLPCKSECARENES